MGSSLAGGATANAVEHPPIAADASAPVVEAHTTELDAEDDSPPAVAPGWQLSLETTSGRTVTRVTHGPLLWGPGAGLELPPGAEQPRIARWHGMLAIEQPGEYRFGLELAGEARLVVAGREVFSGRSAATTWQWCDGVELEFGSVPVELEFAPGDQADARLKLGWQGPRLLPEPVPARLMSHTITPDTSAADPQRGGHLAEALRCAACHTWLGATDVIEAPDLGRAAADLRPEWLTAWLAEPASARRESSSSRRMPHQGLSPAEAADVAAYLQAIEPLPRVAALPKSAKFPPPRPATSPKSTEDESAPPLTPAARGEALLLTVGCLACHRWGVLGSESWLDGGDLRLVGQKRPPEFFSSWLADPARHLPNHRMPRFPLDAEERADLAATLAATTTPSDEPRRNPNAVSDAPPPGEPARGAELVRRHRCAACHPGLPQDASDALARPSDLSLAASPELTGGCLSEEPAAGVPRYPLDAARRADLRAYLSERTPGTPDAPGLSASNSVTAGASLPPKASLGPDDGVAVLRRRLCLGCHARDENAGLRAHLPALAAAHPELAPRLAGLAPPSLTTVGDKLERAALGEAVTGAKPGRRPWLGVRMPRFELSETEREALVDYLIAQDRLPEAALTPPASELPAATARVAGSRLVTADGFGCTSCNAVGTVAPENVALAARGTDLAGLGQRVRRAWFERWVRNPARIVPQMEMPSIQLPVRGVLDERLDHQLAAVWQMLNEPGFRPPLPNPIRVVRRANHPEPSEPAVVLTDVLEVGKDKKKDKLVRPFLIGLANRHNGLLDLEQARLVGWWLGDAAQQRTRGKAWFWEPAGSPVVLRPLGDSDWIISQKRPRASTSRSPESNGQVAAELDGWNHVAGGVELRYRLRFLDGEQSVTQSVRERWTTLAATASLPPGFLREIAVDTDELTSRLDPLGLRIWPGDDQPLAAPAVRWARPHSLVMESPLGQVEIRHASAENQRWWQENEAWGVWLEDAPDGTRAVALEYRLETPADAFPPPPAVTPPVAAALSGFPGFTATRLPLSGEEMPTGLAWRGDGTLVYSSLKGRVLWARDTDGDGLEDTSGTFSDELACPYGLAVVPLAEGGEALDVSNKYALLRLFDDDRDDRADRTTVLADGWGYTDDYHDWAVGLPRDAAGNYFLALACQQNRRDEPAYRARGTVIRLLPDPKHPTRAFRWETWAEGLRFPMGLWLDEAERLWASDNQGNYTPFNELNLLLPGRHYGFLNDWEERAGRFRGANQPAVEPPAVAIPHPWTRSVNGLTQLRTPVALQGPGREPHFGPYEGHLLGCEYDTRRLVRLTVEQVGSVWQGAVYPFSIPPDDPAQPGPLGPLVSAVAPDGDLYLGSIRDSAWGGGNNSGELIRLTPTGRWPTGLARIEALSDGFRLHFTAPLDPARGAERGRYTVERFRREATPDYGGPDLDRGPVAITALELAPDLRSVRLRLDPWTPGFVYAVRLRSLTTDGEEFFPAEGYYTLHAMPGNAEPEEE